MIDNKNKFYKACKNGDLVKAQEYYSNNYNADINYAFRGACINNHLNVSKWLQSLDKNIHLKNINIFSLVCFEGHLNVAQWLYSLGIDIHFKDDQAFRYACENGQLKLAQWLYSLGVNINSINDNAFRYACKNGHLELAQWLESKGVNIHSKNENAFIWACFNGYLEVAKWLVLKGVDIHAENECAFRNACFYRKLDVIKWLYQFKINLVFLEYIPDIKILKEVFQLSEKEIKLFRAIMRGDKKKIKKAIEREINYEILDHFAFRNSCYYNNIKIVKYLSNINSRYYFETNEINMIVYYEVQEYSKNTRNFN